MASDHRFMESAKLFAQTDVSFEKIALKFAMLEEKEPLKAFLKEKLHLYRDNIKVCGILHFML
jgi:hypothetical protein